MLPLLINIKILTSKHVLTCIVFPLDATRKLAFLGKDGFDIFGNNKLFAPRIKWEALEGTVEVIKDAAEKYENAFNDIISTVKDTENFKAVSYRQNHEQLNHSYK